MSTPEKPQLAPCPCGRVPTSLHIDHVHAWDVDNVYGDCCGLWFVQAESFCSENEAREAWNAAPRGHGSP